MGQPQPFVMRRPIKICFVGLYAYSLFNEKTRYQFGGAEVRSFLFSTRLAATGKYKVSFVVFDHGQPPIEEWRGITVYSHSGYKTRSDPRWIQRFRNTISMAGGILARSKRFPYRRLVNGDPTLMAEYVSVRMYDKLQSLIRRVQHFITPSLRIGNFDIWLERYHVYDEIDSDIYCVFGVTNLSGEIAAYCASRGKKFILFLADITNLDVAYQSDAQGMNVYGDYHHVGRYSLLQADLIIAQLETQRQLLQERFGRIGVMVRNPIDLSSSVSCVTLKPEGRNIALWIGRADTFKKMPLLLLELAKACPDVQFAMVMNPHYPNVTQRVIEQKPCNVTLYETVPFDEIETYFARAFVFVSTSVTEGFPNTFLQAGKWGVPLLSLHVDPDGFIQHYNCGIVAHGNMDLMASGLRTIQLDQAGPQLYSENIRKYVRRHHELDSRVLELDTAIGEMFNSPSNRTTVQRARAQE